MGIFMLFTLPEAICRCLETLNVYVVLFTLFCIIVHKLSWSLVLTSVSYSLLPEAVCYCLQTHYVCGVLVTLPCTYIHTNFVATTANIR